MEYAKILTLISLVLYVQGKLDESDLRGRIARAYDAFDPYTEYFSDDDRKPNIEKILAYLNGLVDDFGEDVVINGLCGLCFETDPWCPECFGILHLAMGKEPELAADLEPLVAAWLYVNQLDPAHKTLTDFFFDEDLEHFMFENENADFQPGVDHGYDLEITDSPDSDSEET